MKKRGPGSGRINAAREKAASLNRKFPWKQKGLSRADRVIKFLQWLPITKGIKEGKRMRLLPSQREFVNEVYGRLDSNGHRVVNLAIKSEPKGNGKTGFLTGLALCHLLGPESEPRGEVYSAAIDRDQAGIVYNELEAIIYAVPEFAARVNPVRFHKKLEVLEGDGVGSVYAALSADARSAHGRAPSFWVYDELAQAKSRDLLDNLLESLGKRDQALGAVISTQAEDDLHPLSQLIDDAIAADDTGTYLQLRCADDEADPFDINTIKSCNEAFGKFLNQKDVMKSARRAKRLPAFEPKFRNLRLNQRISGNSDRQLLTKNVWKEGAVPVDPESLIGRKCYGGLDLSATRDLTSLELVFSDDEVDLGYDVLSFFWTPGTTLKERSHDDRAPYELWRDQGHLNAPDGRVVRYGFVAKEIAELDALYDIQAIGYDRWRIEQFRQDLSDIGCEVALEPFGQGFKDMGPALDYLAEVALDGRLRHGGHPVLTWCFSNAITVKDPAGNLKFDKDKARNRIDGAVALAMALGTAKRFDADIDQAQESYLETHEVLML